MHHYGYNTLYGNNDHHNLYKCNPFISLNHY